MYNLWKLETIAVTLMWWSKKNNILLRNVVEYKYKVAKTIGTSTSKLYLTIVDKMDLIERVVVHFHHYNNNNNRLLQLEGGLLKQTFPG